MTTWYWAFLKPSTGRGVVVTPIVVMLAVFGGEFLLARQVRKS